MEQRRKEKIWVLREDSSAPESEILSLCEQTGFSPVCARLLYHRGLKTAEAVKRFLCCEDTAFHSPFLMKDVELAVARIRVALERKERIVIYGDYDVDGVTSVSMLYLYLTELGGDVGYYIPSRSGEGYGLSCAALDKLRADGVGLVITVDTGITACEEAEYAKQIGIDMVITDQQECRATLPDAVAVVNPHRPDCSYPFKELAGVGVVFKLIAAFEATLGAEKGEPEIDGVRRVAARFSDLVAIGTIADVMPITDENRLIVTLGLSQIERTERVGLAALLDKASAGASGKPQRRRKITSSFIGFGVAPRINAAGRMSEATLAVELLLAKTAEEADRMAAELCEINSLRQSEENTIAEQAYRRIEEEFDPETTRVLVLEDDHWRQGIIGIVCSRITERYGLPSILVSFDGATEGFDSPDDQGKGSGRSVKGMNLVEALTACEDLLVKFGGHELAAGLTIRRDKLDAFRARINAYAAKCLPDGGVCAQVEADLTLEMRDVTIPLAEELSHLEPFGVANPVPHFILRDLTVERITELGGGKHLKLQVGREGISHTAMLFSTPRSRFPYVEGDRIDLLCTVDINEFRDIRTVQLIVQDFKPSQCYEAECNEHIARYHEVRAGAEFCAAEDLIPVREDFAHVYQTLRREFRQGKDIFTERALLPMLNAGAPHSINYGKMKYILEIFHELKICGVEEIEQGVYRFDIYFNASKTNIEKSYLLKKLKSQCKA